MGSKTLTRFVLIYVMKKRFLFNKHVLKHCDSGSISLTIPEDGGAILFRNACNSLQVDATKLHNKARK